MKEPGPGLEGGVSWSAREARVSMPTEREEQVSRMEQESQVSMMTEEERVSEMAQEERQLLNSKLEPKVLEEQPGGTG